MAITVGGFDTSHSARYWRRLTAADALRVLTVAAPMLIFLAHSSLFWGWIVDDAGISFAYARSLVRGDGLVSQPGFEAVEGYSNPLWVLLQAPFMLTGLFDAGITPKVLSVGLVAVSFVLLYEAMTLAMPRRREWWSRAAPALPLLLLSVNTSFVVWTTSGLENPLFVFELSLLLYLSMRTVMTRELTLGAAFVVGLVVAAAALTRPDGVLLALAYPFLVLGLGTPAVERTRHLVAYFAAVALPMVAFLSFRFWYFGELYPNTYYAKGGISLHDLDTKAGDLAHSVVGFGQVELHLLVVAAVVVGAFAFRRPAMRVAGVFLACTAAGVLLLPPDWMRENRFCSLFVVCFYCVAALELYYAGRRLSRALPTRTTYAGIAATAAIVLLSTGWFVGRSVAFSREPTVPMTAVEQYFGDRFEGYARLLGVEDPSLLTLDIGGLVYKSDLRVYDLVGLTDRTIARSVQDDPAVFHDYVLEEIRPTFIHTHGLYAVYAALDHDPRFRELYRPICEQIDPWVAEVWRFYWYSGDYVRRDVVLDDATVARMQQSCQTELPYPGN
ncbi:MAG TPA: hypothetical protein VG845_04610 [Dehalococcoidia bacterium]|nr:hypothetical protein [Dehalococcoidia bacterium]